MIKTTVIDAQVAVTIQERNAGNATVRTATGTGTTSRAETTEGKNIINLAYSFIGIQAQRNQENTERTKIVAEKMTVT